MGLILAFVRGELVNNRRSIGRGVGIDRSVGDKRLLGLLNLGRGHGTMTRGWKNQGRQREQSAWEPASQQPNMNPSAHVDNLRDGDRHKVLHHTIVMNADRTDDRLLDDVVALVAVHDFLLFPLSVFNAQLRGRLYEVFVRPSGVVVNGLDGDVRVVKSLFRTDGLNGRGRHVRRVRGDARKLGGHRDGVGLFLEGKGRGRGR